MRSIWDGQDPGGPHVDPINFAIWDTLHLEEISGPFYWRFVNRNSNLKNAFFSHIDLTKKSLQRQFIVLKGYISCIHLYSIRWWQNLSLAITLYRCLMVFDTTFTYIYKLQHHCVWDGDYPLNPYKHKNVITRPCHNCSGSLVKPKLEVRREWTNVSHKIWHVKFTSEKTSSLEWRWVSLIDST